jgi:hypothetical protein
MEQLGFVLDPCAVDKRAVPRRPVLPGLNKLETHTVHCRAIREDVLAGRSS